MAKDFEMGYLLDFYGEVLTPKQREMLNQYYNDDLSLTSHASSSHISRIHHSSIKSCSTRWAVPLSIAAVTRSSCAMLEGL